MSGPEMPAATAAPARRTMAFRKSRNGPVPTREQARRQSDLVQSAWRHFGAAAPMIAFLNTRHDGLDGQPLHLAIESDEGFGRVEQLLADMALQALPATNP